MKSTKQLPQDEAELQAVGFKICSMKLIQLVRRNDVLYNSDADGYSDKNHKELIWERIQKQLYPQYDGVNEHIKELIRNSVRRRWKTLRNAIAREVKRNATLENYSRKKESPIIAELEFLIPHIKSAHCAKLADELGLRESYQFVNETNDNDDDEDLDLIDLTGEFEVKPNIFKTDPDELGHADDAAGTDCSSSDSTVMVASDALYPTVQLATGIMAAIPNGDTASSTSSSCTKNRSIKESRLPTKWSKEFCALAHYKGGEFTTVGDAVQDGEELNSQADEQTETIVPTNKKRRMDETTSNENIDWHARITQLFNMERERNGGRFELRAAEHDDEDRMFLLSLVSDLKRIPASKKPFIKAEIATVIARGLNSSI